MNRFYPALCCTLFLLAAAPPAATVEATPGQVGCDTAETCLQRLRQISGNKHGVDAEDGALIEKLLSFGPDIVPALVDMLADPNEAAAELAAYGLRETKHLDRRFLPQIKAGLDRGLGWLPPILCRMEGDDVAREAVARFVVSTSAPHNQEAVAVAVCGGRAIAPIVEVARCAKSCPANMDYGVRNKRLSTYVSPNVCEKRGIYKVGKGLRASRSRGSMNHGILHSKRALNFRRLRKIRADTSNRSMDGEHQLGKKPH